MASWEFEKPSTWSLGKRIGFLAVIFLLVGPFLPFWVRDYGTRTDDVSYIQYSTFGLLGLIPIFSALLIVLLLYLKINIYYEKDEEKVKINHFVLMMWSFCFVLIYIADAVRAKDQRTAFATAYAGIGLWMMIFGFIMCFAAGFIEWRHPLKVGPRILFKRDKKKPTNTNVIANPYPKPVSSFESTKAISYKSGKKGNTLTPKNAESIPSHNKYNSEAASIEAVNREPRNEEEKELIRWSRHISEEGKTYERCIKCGKYVFISAEEKGGRIMFKCPECGNSFILKK